MVPRIVVETVYGESRPYGTLQAQTKIILSLWRLVGSLGADPQHASIRRKVWEGPSTSAEEYPEPYSVLCLIV